MECLTMQKILLLALLLVSPTAFGGDSDIECFNHSVRYEFFHKEDGFYFNKIADQKQEDVGPFPTAMAASDAAVKDCEELPPEESESQSVSLPEEAPEAPGTGEIDEMPSPKGYIEDLEL
jgi:hypothetical protein